MKKQNCIWLTLFLGSLLLMLVPVNVSAADRQEGGYYGTTDQGHNEVAYNFLKHFNYEQYYNAIKAQFVHNNNNRVDAMDIAVFAGHGNPWYIQTTNGDVEIHSCGNTDNQGWGDWNVEFVAFQSCKVVPSPIERADWWTNWVQTNGVFDGLHQALGFRTDSYQSTDQDVTDDWGRRVQGDYAIWQSWFDAINSKGRGDEFGSCVMHPSTQQDTHSSFVADPPANHTDLTVWYQH